MTQQEFIDEYNTHPNEAQRQVANFVSFLRQKYKSAPPAPRSGISDFEHEAFVGMPSNRQECEDSTAWVSNTRQAERGESP